MSEQNTVTSVSATKKHPNQGKFKPAIKIDRNKHGIRRETVLQPKRVGRKKV
ncbi:MAG: hypothetical protein RLZZ195_920 [Pseudomonadota bacterium]|jgi:hypothetical protein